MVKVICSLQGTCAFAYDKCPHGQAHEERAECNRVCKVGQDLFGEDAQCIEVK